MRLKSNEKERKCYNYQHAIKHAISSVSESFMKQQVFLLTTISNLHFYLSPGQHAACFTLHAETISQPPKPESICHKAVVHSLPRLGPTRCQRAPGCAPCSVGDEQWPGQHVLRVSWPWDPHRAVMILQTLQHSHCSDCIMHWEQAFFMFGISCNEFSYIKS